MNRRSALNHFGLLPIAFVPAIKTVGNDLVLELQDRWEKSKDYSIATFEAMPEEFIEFSPTETQFSFAHHFMHLSFINALYMEIIFDPKGGYGNAWNENFKYKLPDGMNVMKASKLPAQSVSENKKLVLNYLKETFDYVISSIGKLQDKDLIKGKDRQNPDWLSGHSHLDMIIRGENHTAHHRAQTILYLRMKGAVPPNYAEYNKLPV